MHKKLTSAIDKELAQCRSAKKESDFIRERLRAEMAEIESKYNLATNRTKELGTRYQYLLNKYSLLLRNVERQFDKLNELYDCHSHLDDESAATKQLEKLKMGRIRILQMCAGMIEILDEARELISWTDHPAPKA